VTRPLVSIVTPSYNQAAFLEETMRSVLEQDYEPIEYVVVDDGSTDGSVEIVERYADRLAWWTAQETRGQAAALNLGFEHTTGDYMAFVNSDDALLPGAITALVDALESAEDVLLAYGDALTYQDRREIGVLRARAWDPAHMVRSGANPVPQQASMWRRRAWELAGPFDETSFFYFEYEFLVRLASFGRAQRIDRPLAKFRLHSSSKTSMDSVAKAEDFERVADVFFTGPQFPAEHRNLVPRGRASLHLRAAFVYYQAGAIGRARRAFRRALLLSPRAFTPLFALLFAKSLVPERWVRRRRRRREAAP
jgi:glycosyltransferase involved in cell wall biosynthesis